MLLNQNVYKFGTRELDTPELLDSCRERSLAVLASSEAALIPARTDRKSLAAHVMRAESSERRKWGEVAGRCRIKRLARTKTRSKRILRELLDAVSYSRSVLLGPKGRSSDPVDDYQRCVGLSRWSLGRWISTNRRPSWPR